MFNDFDIFHKYIYKVQKAFYKIQVHIYTSNFWVLKFGGF